MYPLTPSSRALLAAGVEGPRISSACLFSLSSQHGVLGKATQLRPQFLICKPRGIPRLPSHVTISRIAAEVKI